MTTPVELGQQSASLGRKAGLTIEYVEHEDGHTIPSEVLRSAAKYLKGLLAQKAAHAAVAAVGLEGKARASEAQLPPAPPAPLPVTGGRGGSTSHSSRLNYDRWDALDDGDEADREREFRRKQAERRAKGIYTAAEEFEREGQEAGPAGNAFTPPTVADETAHMRDSLHGFDPADHQRERVAHLEKMRQVDTGEGGERMDEVELHNEQVLRDAKQQGRQGNVYFGGDGKCRIRADDEVGGQTKRYRWGQNNSEVTITARVPAGTKSNAVQLTTTSNSVRVTVQGDVLCSGPTHRPILSDESTYALETSPSGERQLVVTLVKRDETSGSEHWSCAIKGEGKIDPSLFGVPVATVDPNDPSAIERILSKPVE